MRRDQVLKVCLNHHLTPEISFKWRGDKSLTWAAMDFSDAEASTGNFALRFKNFDQAVEFLDAVNKMTDTANKSSDAKCIACLTPNPSVHVAPTPVHSESKVPLSELFKPKPGNWECKSCYVLNKSSDARCTACATPNPLTPEGSSENIPSSTTASKFSGSTSKTAESTDNTFGNFQFGSLSAETKAMFGPTKEPPGAFLFRMHQPAEPSTVSFGLSTVKGSNVEGFKPEGASKVLPALFGGQAIKKTSSIPIPPVTAAPSYIFGSTPTDTIANAGSPSSNEIESVESRFGGSPQKNEFNFSGVRSFSPVKIPKSPEAPSDADDDVEPSDVDNIYFQPVIPLPPKDFLPAESMLQKESSTKKANPPKRTQICRYCGKKFQSISMLKCHRRTQHGQFLEHFNCRFCSCWYFSQSCLDRHLEDHAASRKMLHRGKKQHTCGTCGKSFLIKSSLDAHVRMHKKKTYYQCKICKKIFILKDHRDRHMKGHKCPLCKGVIKSDSHICAQKPPVGTPLVCFTCAKGFLVSADYKKHMLADNCARYFKCRLCDKKFRYYIIQRDHMKMEH